LLPELDIASQGESIDDAVRNLKEAAEAFFEVATPEEVRAPLKIGDTPMHWDRPAVKLGGPPPAW
jgi:predicted RNase H-like HicB family nuclease